MKLTERISLTKDLLKAAYRGDVDELNKLTSLGVDVNDALDDGVTPLMMAARSDKADAVKFLINSGADVNAEDNDGNSVLFRMFELPTSYSSELFLSIINAGVNLKKHGSRGRSLLSAIASGKNIELLNILIATGIDVNEVDNYGYTALTFALPRDSSEYRLEQSLAMTNALINAGADVNHADAEGVSILMKCCECDSSRYGYGAKALNILIKAGADINVQDIYGRTALMHAAGEGRCCGWIRDIISAGANPYIKDNKGLSLIDMLHDTSKFFGTTCSNLRRQLNK